jgi:hypothetical protein
MASPGPNDDPGGAIELERALGSAVHAAAHQGAKTINSRLFRAVFPTIARELLADTESAQQFRADVFVPVRAAAKARILAATERDEVASAIDPDLLFDLIYGGLLYRVLFGLPVDDGVARALADLVMHGAAGRQYRKRAAAPETSPRSSTRDPRP